MDLETATQIVRDDMAAVHGPSPVWDNPDRLYQFIWDLSRPDEAYGSYTPELRDAYIMVRNWAHSVCGDPHTLCNSSRCTMGEGHTLPCNADAIIPSDPPAPVHMPRRDYSTGYGGHMVCPCGNCTYPLPSP